MSLPDFSTQSELFSTAGLSTSLFCQTDRYRIFAKRVYPPLAGARGTLEQCYCVENGRIAIEPVLMLGVSILQEIDGVPDRQAVERLRYHAGWNFALNRQLGDEVFHPSSLVNFRHRLEEHQQSALGFRTLLNALVEAGWVWRQSRQRLDSTQMFGRVAKMSRLDCVRESMRLALQELEGVLAAGEPTRNFITGIVTHPAHHSDEAGALLMEHPASGVGGGGATDGGSPRLMQSRGARGSKSRAQASQGRP